MGFAAGDRVVCVDAGLRLSKHFPFLKTPRGIRRGAEYTVATVALMSDGWAIQLAEVGHVECEHFWGYGAVRFRKVERRTDTLSIESFLTIKPGFEEPKRAPAKKRERV